MRLVGEPDRQLRSCNQCKHNRATIISWWCTNEDAISVRGTSFPTVYHCPYWEAAEPYRWWHWFNPDILKVDVSRQRLGPKVNHPVD